MKKCKYLYGWYISLKILAFKGGRQVVVLKNKAVDLKTKANRGGGLHRMSMVSQAARR